MQCTEAQNRKDGRIKLKMHIKTNSNNCRRGGGGEEELRRERRKEKMGEKKRAPWFSNR